MSDFDKEAEREKLEKRFAEEERERETTERMSELLLQGATMTDIHCEECGNPLFRYDGQTFCSSCQRPVEEVGSAEGETAEPTSTGTGTADSAPETAGSATDQQIPVTGPRAAGDGRNPRSEATGTQGSAESASRPTQRTQVSQPTGTTTDTAPATEPPTGSSEPADGLAATEASLSRTLRRQAAAAERADDLGRTRTHLAAAREAAEALAAVRSAR